MYLLLLLSVVYFLLTYGDYISLQELKELFKIYKENAKKMKTDLKQELKKDITHLKKRYSAINQNLNKLNTSIKDKCHMLYDNLRNIYSYNMAENEFSLIQIKNKLTESNMFPESKNIDDKLIKNIDYLKILKNYSNYREWSSKELGDVLYIRNKLSKKTDKSSRYYRYYDMLLDDFIDENTLELQIEKKNYTHRQYRHLQQIFTNK